MVQLLCRRQRSIVSGGSVQASSVPIVLLADVNVRRRSLLRRLLEGCAVTVDCNTVTDLVFKTRAGDIDAIVLGSLADDPSSSLEALRRLRPEKISAVVFIADQSSEDLAIGALQAGVRHYFKNPICLEEVARTILGLLPQQKLHSGLDCIVGDSGGMRRVRELIQCFGKTEATVLITGETGTGKELIAANIHRISSRAGAPMITVNSSAIPDSLVESELFGFEKGAFTGAVTPQKGKFALAHGGTIFLD
ncbi:MAG TPA: sigma 54-interacting transcriptional regulator, partial [Bryobacteraceae bacterium]|nr:sigma 54-interacting transcriptional regulator [Bryobacteraceae bacterium]